VTIYFTNGQSKVIETYTDFIIKDTYMLLKISRYEETIYVPLYNVLYITSGSGV
jgi:hypothetical protein